VRSSPEFADLLARAQSRYCDALRAFRNAGGDDLLGITTRALEENRGEKS
jgi:hypothetical protein